MSDVTIYREGNQIIAKNVRILPGGFLNFSGRETRNNKTGQIYNHSGQRNFWFEVPEEYFDIFIDESINLKITESSMPVEEDEERKGRVKVNVNIDNGRVPEFYTREGIRDETGKIVTKYKEMNPKTIALLDDEFFEEADLYLNISRKNPNQHSLYLVTGAFTFKHISNPIKESIEIETQDDEEVPFT